MRPRKARCVHGSPWFAACIACDPKSSHYQGKCLYYQWSEDTGLRFIREETVFIEWEQLMCRGFVLERTP